MDVTELRRWATATTHVYGASWRARRVRPAAERLPAGHHRRLPGRRPAGAAPRALPFSSARKYSGTSRRRRDGNWLLGRARRAARSRRPRPPSGPSRSARRACGCCCSAAATCPSTTTMRPAPDAGRPGRPGAAAAPRRRATPCATSPSRTSRQGHLRRQRGVGGRGRGQAGPAGRTRWTPASCPTTTTELADTLEEGTVFGRVTPQQKRDMVQRCSHAGTRWR